MAKLMIEQGAGSWWVSMALAGVTVFGGLVFGALGGCATDDPAASQLAEVRAEGSMLVGSARAAVERSNAAPEQVVQHLAADPASVRPDAPGSTRLSVTGGPGAAPEPGSRAPIGEPITSKHLEAELNRLEAELGR
jgi:hypothetical protein